MKKLINEPADVVAEALLGSRPPTPTCGSTTSTGSSTGPTRPSPARSG